MKNSNILLIVVLVLVLIGLVVFALSKTGKTPANKIPEVKGNNMIKGTKMAYSELSSAEVRRFQKWVNAEKDGILKTDGVVDAATAAALDDYYMEFL